MTKNFEEFAESHQLKSEHFPFSKLGMNSITAGYIFIGTSIVLFFVKLGISVLDDFLLSNANIPRVAYDLFLLPMSNVCEYILRVLNVLFYLSLLAIVGSIVVYVVALVLRWRSFERNCVSNDFEARKLKKKIVKSLGLQKQIDAINKKYTSSNNSSTKEKSYEDKAKLDALNDVKNMQVYINTRQSIDSNDIEKRCQIIMKAPLQQKEYECMQTLLKDFDKIATKLVGGKFSFGAQIISADRKTISYFDVMVVPDKFDYAAEIEELTPKVEEDIPSEYTFPLSLFTDHTAAIEKAKKSSKRWSDVTLLAMDDLLSTLNISAKRIEENVGARNMQIIYEVAFQPQESALQSLEKQIDRRFDTYGTTISMTGNKLTLVIGLPVKYQSPIDTSTLFHAAFG